MYVVATAISAFVKEFSFIRDVPYREVALCSGKGDTMPGHQEKDF